MNVTMQKFGYPETLLKEYKNWVVVLKPQQTTIGTMVLIEKSDAESLGDIGSESWTEFKQVSHDVEGWVTQTFGAEKFNYLALMMKDPNVHFHFIPRYSKPVKIDEDEFTDIDWPGKTELNKIDLSEGQFTQIMTKLRSVQ